MAMVVQQAAMGRPMDRLSADELNWDVLYADLAPRVYNYFRYRMGSEADVEELTSRTFERAWRSRAIWRQRSSYRFIMSGIPARRSRGASREARPFGRRIAPISISAPPMPAGA